jgi:hypothetical protein
MSVDQANAHLNQLVLRTLTFPTFQSSAYPTWAQDAQTFFVAHKLFSIVKGTEPNPAGDVTSEIVGGDLLNADGEILIGEPTENWPALDKSIWDWNRRHTAAYGLLKASVRGDKAVISKVANCESAHEIWQTLANEYGNSSSIMLRVLERQLPTMI